MWRLSNRDQLALELDEAPPKNAEELRARLQRLGLGAQYRVLLTTNRTVVVSYSGGELRIHNSFLSADEEVWKAIIIFVHGRNRVVRREARRTILEFPVARSNDPPRRRRRAERTHPADIPLIRELSSRRHIRRDGWDEALHTLLHEMVHQWQDEQGLAVDHGASFRAKARAVGITPLACRAVA